MKRTVIVLWIVVLCVWGWVISGALAGQRPPPDLDQPIYTGEAEWRQDYEWKNGSPEHACSRNGHPVEGDGAVNWHVCHCQHKSCDAINGSEEQALEAWDANCSAKYKRGHCHCEESCHAT